MRAKKDFYYNGAYSQVMERDNNMCRKCGSEDELAVHHIDHSGSHRVESLEANNDLDNLIVLCRKCHADIHAITYKMLAEKYQKDVLDIADLYLSGEIE